MESSLDIAALKSNKNIVARNYWRNRLAGFEPNTYFNTDPSPGSPESDRAEYILRAPAHVHEGLVNVAESIKARHIVLLSALGVLIQKYASISDIIVFCPSYSGKNPEEDHVVPVRMSNFSGASFQDSIYLLKDNLIQDFKHANYPIERILNIQKDELQDLPKIGMLVEELHQSSSFDNLLPEILFSFGFSDTLTLRITYDTGKFNAAYIEGVAARYFSVLLKSIINRERDIKEIELISAEEKNKILYDFNRTEKTFPADLTILDLFAVRVKERPESIAVQFKDQQLTYAALDARSNRVADYLSKTVSGKGVVIGVQLERSVELMIAIFGILKAGCIYMPLAGNYPLERKVYALRNSGAELIFTERENFADFQGEFACADVAALPPLFVSSINLAKASDVAYIIYTSGSTGKPKGVMISHRSMMNRLCWMQNQYSLQETDIILQKTPVVFDVSIWELFWWVLCGARLVLAPPNAEKDPGRICEIIKSEKISVLHFVPSMLGVFLSYLTENRRQRDLESLKYVFASGEELKVSDARLFLKYCPTAGLHNLYGPTEATVDVSYHPVLRSTQYRRIPIGKPIDNTTLYIFNNDLQLQPVGVPGELFIGGENLAIGYVNQVVLTREKFIVSPLDGKSVLYRTGDIARWLPDGNIEFLGRIDNQVKIRGNRIELNEIEHAIRSVRGVENVIVLTREANSVLQLIAYLIKGAGFSEMELRSFLASTLPEYMVPAHFVFIDSVPVTVNGKIDRTALLSLKIRNNNEYVAPVSDLEKALQFHWRNVLDIEQIGIEDNFFRIGGDSILAVGLIGTINHALSVSLSMTDLFKNETIKELACFIETSDFRDLPREYFQVSAELEQFNRDHLAQYNDDTIEAVYPMSDIERGMCFVHRASPDDAIYFEQLVTPVRYKKFDIDILQKAIDLLVEKHEVLRTGLNINEFTHIVYNKLTCKVWFYDFSSYTEAEQETNLRIHLENSRTKHFDLTTAPLWRISIYKLRDDYHLMVFENHHAILDGWSHSSIITEINNTYGDLLRHPSLKLSPLSSHYRDFISEELYMRRNERNLRFWKEELKGYKKLKLDTGTDARVFKSIRMHHPVSWISDLENVAEQRLTTVKNILFSAYIYTLKILACESDVLVGLVTFNRPLKKDGEKVLGNFLNTIPFRIQIPERISWAAYLKLIDRKLLEVKAHENISLIAISQAMGTAEHEVNPFFDTLFNLVNFHVYEELRQEETSPAEVKEWQQNVFLRGHTLFDVNLHVNKNGVYGMYELVAPFINENTFADYLNIFSAVIERIVFSPEDIIDLEDIYWNDEIDKANRELKSYAYGDSALNKENINDNSQQQSAVSLVRQNALLKLKPYLLSYLKHQSESDQQPVELPADRPRVSINTYTEADVDIAIPKGLVESIRKFEKRSGIETKIILMSALKILLCKYTRQSEIVIGTNSDNINNEKLRNLTGSIASLTSIGSSIPMDISFSDYVSSLKEIYDHSIRKPVISPDDAARIFASDKEERAGALFNVLYQYEAIKTGFPDIEELSINDIKTDFERGKYELNLMLQDCEDSIYGKLAYGAEYFDPSTMILFAKRYYELLEKLLLTPDNRLSTFEIVSQEEKHQVLHEFNNTKVDYPKGSTIIDLFEDRVKRTPENVALRYHNETMSYRELDTTISKVACYLREVMGVASGDLVGLMLERDQYLIPLIYGILKAGAAYIPIDPHYPDERIDAIVNDSKLKVLITRGKYKKTVPGFTSGLVNLDIVMNQVLAGTPETISPKVSGIDLAYIIYTSGSTGNPKGVMIEHNSLVNIIRCMDQRYPLGEADCYLLKTTFSFDVSCAEIFGWFLNGGSLAIPEAGVEKDPNQILDAIQKYKITHLNFVPSMFSVFLERLENKGTKEIRSLKYIFLAGEALPGETVNRFRALNSEVSLENIYGPTEGTIYSSNYSVSDSTDQLNIPIGKPLNNVKLYVLDPDNNLQPKGVPGELCIGGAGLARGYLNNVALTARKFVHNPYVPQEKMYKTGDLARWLPDGNIEFLGRIDNQVKVRGFRIELGEIEARLLSHDLIKEAVVLAVENGKDKSLVAYYVSVSDIQVSELRKHLSGKLPEYMIPAYYVPLRRLPLTSNGKLNRKALPDPELIAGEDYHAPSGDIEKKLVQIWSEVLQLDEDKIGVDRSFFELGGHSLRAMTLATKIFKQFGIEIPLKTIFEFKDIRRLAKIIGEANRSEYTLIKKTEEKDYYALTIAQKRLYFIHEFDKSSLAFNVLQVMKIDGALDKQKLRDVFNMLIARHESLRTSFEIINGEPVQRISKQVDFDIEHFRSAEHEFESILDRFVKPFDLSKAPLLRAALIETAPQEHFLMIDMHHIIIDGTSLSILIRDFNSLYNNEQLPALELSYKDYSEWQQTAGYQKRLNKQKDFWMKEFSEPITPLAIPVDFKKPSMAGEGGLIDFNLSVEETNGLKAIAEKEEMTLAMLVLSVFTVLLGKLANQEDVVVGMPIAGRQQPGLESMIGMFPVVLPLRNYPKADLTFQAFLSSLKSKFLAALDNQDYPYEELAKELRLERSTSRNPWFDTMIMYQNFETSEIMLHDLKVAPHKGKILPTQQNLDLTVTERGDRIFLKLNYSRELFKEETIHRFIRYFHVIVETVIRDASIRISDIEIITDFEKHQILYEFNDTKKAIIRDKTFSPLFEEQVKKTPLNVAVAHNGSKLTYKELYEQSEKLSKCLLANGMNENRNVALYLPRSIDMLIGIIAIFNVRGAYVPIDVDYPRQRVMEILSDSEAGIVITTLELVPVIQSLQHEIPSIGKIVCIDQQDQLPITDVKPVKNAGAEDLAYVIYTSGTTGKPKGAMVHQLGMINHLFALVDVLELSEKDTIAQTASPCFDISVWQFLCGLIVGGTTCIIDKDKVLEPGMLLEELQRNAVTIFQSVPSLMATFLDGMHEGTVQSLPKLRWMIPTGEPLSIALTRKWYSHYPNIRLLNAYGPAETADDVTTHVVGLPGEHQLFIPIGKPIQNMHVYVLNQSLRLCPIGVKGEICVAGLGVGKGYWKDADKTKGAFVPNPFISGSENSDYGVLYKTGDMGYYLEDGSIVSVGRVDDQVKIRGIRVALGEIENQLLGHEMIREAVVLAKKENDDTRLIGYYVSDKEIEIKELERYLSDRLPGYMVPSCFVHLARLPLTLNGKVNRRALPDPEINVVRAVYVAPSNELEEKLVEIWSSILKLNKEIISINSNFFELGGHSLNAIALTNKIYRELNVKVSLKDFFANPTVGLLSQYIDTHLWLNKAPNARGIHKTEVTL